MIYLREAMFCNCGALIYYPMLVSEPIKCKRCSKIMENMKSTTVTITESFKTIEQVEETKVKGAKIKMKCPKCGADEISYNSAQLRSADEGQTVFYSCDICGWKETVNS